MEASKTKYRNEEESNNTHHHEGHNNRQLKKIIILSKIKLVPSSGENSLRFTSFFFYKKVSLLYVD